MERVMPHDEMFCENCGYMDSDDEEMNYGLCVRNPPVRHRIDEIDGGFHWASLYPETFGNNWCGEWIPSRQMLEQLKALHGEAQGNA